MITLSISEKLLKLIEGQHIPASLMKHTLTDELISEGIVLQQYSGRTKRLLYITDKTAIANWLFNRFQINDLAAYVSVLRDKEATRSDLITVAGNSKAKSTRTFKGFLVNSYMPVNAMLNGQPIIIHPQAGTFQFIYDHGSFVPASDIVIVGVENAENFRWVERQQHLFLGILPLFISRYPQEQSKDMIRWLMTIPNRYLHFGDLDFAGINIYIQEYKNYLGSRASLFIPENIDELLMVCGNKELYDRQKLNDLVITEPAVNDLITLLHEHKKGLEQEVLIN